MAVIVEVELTGATFNGTDAIACTFAYRILNNTTQAVIEEKTVSTEIKSISKDLDADSIMRAELEKAGHWAQWMQMAKKASQYIGKKRQTTV